MGSWNFLWTTKNPKQTHIQKCIKIQILVQQCQINCNGLKKIKVTKHHKVLYKVEGLIRTFPFATTICKCEEAINVISSKVNPNCHQIAHQYAKLQNWQ